MLKKDSFNRSGMLSNFIWIGTLILLFWFVRYSQSGGFGFYADDYSFVTRAITMTRIEFLDFLTNLTPFLKFQASGHPLHPVLITIGSRIGWWFAELPGIYGVGYIIGAANIVLFYMLITRLHSQRLAFLSGLIYVLYAADTTQSYISFALGIQPAIMMVLLAGHAYVSRRNGLAYLFSTLSLLTYETAYAITFAFPLLVMSKRKPTRSETIRFLAVLSVILLVAIAWRALAGENRLGELTARDMIITPIQHMIVGPAVSLGTFLYRPFQVLTSTQVHVLFAAVFGAMLTGLALYCLMRLTQTDTDSKVSPQTDVADSRKGFQRVHRQWQSLNKQTKNLILMAIAGLAMLILAYPFTFTVRAYAITGRDTRVHAAGVIGAALLLGSILLLVLNSAKSRKRAALAILPIGTWMGLLGGYGVLVQFDYVRSQEYQQRFWTSLADYIGEVESGFVLAIDPEGFVDTRHIDANTWNLPYVLQYLYEFPAEWESPPIVYRLLQDWQTRTLTNSTEVKVLDYKWEYVVVPWDKFILLTTQDGRVDGQENELIINGLTKDLPYLDLDAEIPFPPGILHYYLIVE